MSIWEVQDWFKRHVSLDGKCFTISEEQAEAILDSHKNTIITARAGSGKTRVIVAKIIYLIAHEGYDPEDIIAFAFNRDASRELNDRLAKILVDGRPIFPTNPSNKQQIAMTFHSFAARARVNGGEILSDDSCDNKEEQSFITNRSYYIQRFVKEKLNKKKVLQFIRESGEKTEEESFSNDSDVLIPRDDGHFETLNGEIVKSYSEKIIADFLFEHDIDYRYEGFDLYPIELSKFAKDYHSAEKLKLYNVIRPDFYLTDYKLLWEHWGIRGNETPEEIQAIDAAKIFDGGYRAYAERKKWKEWFYSREWMKHSNNDSAAFNNHYLKQAQEYKDLITTYREPFTSREEFEEIIENRLAEFGIRKPKLSEEEIVAKLLNNKNREVVTRLTKQLISFIDRAEQGFIADYDALHDLCSKESDSHVSLFYELALETLNYYTSELTSDPSDIKRRPLLSSCFEKTYTTDFNMLLDSARMLIEEKKEKSSLKVDNYKYIFIDEYQDFSQLFFNLVKALRGRSTNAKLMVVGDDWQAINSYAGSDLKFFENFEDYFSEDPYRLELLTNYRSTGKIVELSNNFMSRAGISGSGSKIIDSTLTEEDILNICNITELRKRKDPNSERRHIEQKYDLVLMDIIRENKGKSICILSRKNSIKCYGSTNNCRDILTKQFEGEDETYFTNTSDGLMKSVSISTVNRAKGCEADVVVIVETDNGSFPVIHPDTKLFRVFGDSKEAEIDEQKRLFYVALTRPKERLYILHEKGFSSENIDQENFLTMLDVNKISDYEPKTKELKDRIIDDGVRSFLATNIRVEQNRRHPDGKDLIVTASNGDEVRQFNASRYRDPEAFELLDFLSEQFKNHSEKKKQRVWVDVQNGCWIHFRKQKSSDLAFAPYYR